MFTAAPKGKGKEVAAMLKAIHAQEDRPAAEQKADQVVLKLESMKLGEAASLVRDGIGETLSYSAFPREHWQSIRTNNPLERINREVRRRTRVVGAFPDGQSALMLPPGNCLPNVRNLTDTTFLNPEPFLSPEHRQPPPPPPSRARGETASWSACPGVRCRS